MSSRSTFMILFLVTGLALCPLHAQITPTFSSAARASVGFKPPLSPELCNGIQEISANTILSPGERLRAAASSTQATSELIVQHLGDGIRATMAVTGVSNTRDEQRAFVSDGSAACSSGFPARITLVPPACEYELVIDANNEGGTGTDMFVQQLRGSVQTLLFRWDSSQPGQRDSTTWRLRLPGRSPAYDILTLNLYAFSRATLGSGPSDRRASIVMRFVPTSNCSGVYLKNRCDAALLRQVECARVIGLGLSSPAHPGGFGLLYVGLPSQALPVFSCDLFFTQPLLIAQLTLDGQGRGWFPSFVVPMGGTADLTFQGLAFTNLQDLIFTDARRIQCP